MSNQLPPQATFELVLDKELQAGGCQLESPTCEFSYNYNFSTDIGSGELVSIDGVAVNIALYPAGLANVYEFLSDLNPLPSFEIDGQEVVIYRVVMDLYEDGSRAAVVMFNEDGSCIEASENWRGEASSSAGA